MREYLKRNMIWVAMLAVLIPLGVMLRLQYGWLVSLQKTSAIAKTAQLDSYLGAVSSEVENYYYKQAWGTLQVPPEMMVEKTAEGIQYHFRKKQVKGAKYLFAVSYVDGKDYSVVRFFDPVSRKLVEEPPLPVERAVYVALAPWKTLVRAGAAVQSTEMTADERDLDNRIILQPISGTDRDLLGVTGMVLDTRFFEHELLPYAIKQALPEFFEHGNKNDLIITVRDGSGRFVFGTGKRTDVVEEVVQRIPFVFKDWKLGLASRFDTPEQLARSNFWINITMSVLLAFVLIGGVGLALRTASREIKLSQMKSDFVSNVSHELRTPLASIRVFGEFLRLGRVASDGKAAEYGEYIETESRRLTQLINNILDFSKIESGAKTYQFDMTDLGHLLRETLRTLEVSLKHKGFRLTYELSDEPLPDLELDRDAIVQTIANLVDNAVKYSGDSTDIRVTLRRTNDCIVLSIGDKGIGISRGEQKKIFDRFHRVSTGLVHDVKGSGLGLSIVNHVVEAHGGRITVESEPGQGSTFRVHLPLPKQEVYDHDGAAADMAGNLGNT